MPPLLQTAPLVGSTETEDRGKAPAITAESTPSVKHNSQKEVPGYRNNYFLLKTPHFYCAYEIVIVEFVSLTCFRNRGVG